MNILYGVSGEGFGHSSRAQVVASYLESKGHFVTIISYGQAYKVLRKKFKTIKVHGLHLVFKRGILSKRRTLRYNLENFPRNLWGLRKMHRIMKESKFDLCISDMEPIVPILSFWYDKPLISFDNQHRLTNLKVKIPKKYLSDYVLAKEVVKTFVRKANHFIITSFAKAPYVDKYRENSTLVPIIVRDDVLKLRPSNKGKVLVYLTKKDRRIIEILQRIDSEFVVFGYNVNRKSGNIEFRTRNSFLDELSSCRAIIATAGFTLMGEALYLRKPYFALPLKGQFEQTFNALFLKDAGYGDFSESPTIEEIERFLGELPKYRAKLRSYRYDKQKLFRVFDRVLSQIKS